MTQDFKKTQITFVLDESGSMAGTRDQTISGFNEFMDSQQDKTLGECRVTLVQFNTLTDKPNIRTKYANKLIDEVRPLDGRSYNPNGMTPLYDAIAQAIKDTEKESKSSLEVIEKLAGHPVKIGPLIVIVIMTDGEENMSKQYDQKQVFDLISEKRQQGWEFIFLGANQDSFASGAKVGVAAGMTANFSSGNIVRAMHAVGQSMSSYRHTYQSAAADLDNMDLSKSTADQEAAIKAFTNKLTGARTNYFSGKTEI